ncbi:MAG: lipid-A-disaccharide synthase [Candidatus Aminicenantes bacterium]|nr:lipid-A-disaccharide synthase [Candidatus Aminicenantes bacterium]
MRNVLVIAAENSAENYGAQVIDEFKKHNSDINFFGIGGERFLERGVDVSIHNRELSVVGLIEVVSSILKLKKIMGRLFREALQRNTAAVLLIDYPDFNLRMAKKCKKAGIPVYYYISPTVWAWRYSRVDLIKKYVDRLFIIFPFEIEVYEKEKIPFTYTGHPLLPLIKIDETREDSRKKWGVKKPGLLVTLMPGSRKSEVAFLLPEMLKAAALLKKDFKITFFLLLANNIERDLVSGFLDDGAVDVEVIEQKHGYNLINASDLVITTCGTSNLEIAMIGVPFMAVYRLNKLSYFLGKRFVEIDMYSIVNILARQRVITELIQRDFTAENIVKEAKRILQDETVRGEMLNQFARLRTMLSQEKNPAAIIYEKISADLEARSTAK